jgi:hypothetical protein
VQVDGGEGVEVFAVEVSVGHFVRVRAGWGSVLVVLVAIAVHDVWCVVCGVWCVVDGGWVPMSLALTLYAPRTSWSSRAARTVPLGSDAGMTFAGRICLWLMLGRLHSWMHPHTHKHKRERDRREKS